MPSLNTETETVIKKILPYLHRRGYDVSEDLDFETAVQTTDRYEKGYIDILVNAGRKKPVFVIEAKRLNRKLTEKDRDQAIKYGASNDVGALFVVVTNGVDVVCYNTKTGSKILWDGKSTEKIPTKEQLKTVIRQLKSNPYETNIKISSDASLPFRPGLPLRQVNALFYRCHSAIRKIEKSEETAFSDFSKLLFLKLLEEKSDVDESFVLPYSYRFHELAFRPSSEADQVKNSVLSMIEEIVMKKSYGEVLEGKIHLKNPKTFHYIVKELSSVSFQDCSLDSKGAAFEYFVRATLKGKKLGQYFTPRDLVEVMLAMIGEDKIISSIMSSEHQIKVLDPACGTGGFLVFLMQDSIKRIDALYKNKKITKSACNSIKNKIKEEVFYGADANEGVAASAKMNMIIAGDGHTNIKAENSLAKAATSWSVENPDCDLILTNPPFGTSEMESLSSSDWLQFDIRSSKGQHLFIQKMVKSLKIDGGELCTVIDEGVLNTESASALRRWLLAHCVIKAVVELPPETFKPNKINVKSSLLYLERRQHPDVDLESKYLIPICRIQSLGYLGSGEKIRAFEKATFMAEIAESMLCVKPGEHKHGYNWDSFVVSSEQIAADRSSRFDYKYWDIEVRKKINNLIANHCPTIKDLNLIKTSRGKSPPSENYVDAEDGYALVIKAGSNIDKYGAVLVENADYIEKSIYDEFVQKAHKEKKNGNIVAKGDVLLSSTGDGTLGKCAVFDLDIPAIADGHVTIIRPNLEKVDPYYLCDYLRSGFGRDQINRSYTGSTGMIELTTEQVDAIVVDIKQSKMEQKKVSDGLRKIEGRYVCMIEDAKKVYDQANKYM